MKRVFINVLLRIVLWVSSSTDSYNYDDDHIYDPELKEAYRNKVDTERSINQLEQSLRQDISDLTVKHSIEKSNLEIELAIKSLKYIQMWKGKAIEDQVEGRVGKYACNVFSPIFIHRDYVDNRSKENDN